MTTSVDNDSRRMIVLDQGIDTELGLVGLGYSPDNGTHFFVTNTIQGRVYRQNDADRLWPLLVDKVKAITGQDIDWSKIDGKPDLATKDDLAKVEKEPGPKGEDGRTWQPYVAEDGNWHLKLISQGGE